MLRKGDCPYWTMEKFQPSLASEPDIVFIDLGGNDAKLRNRIHKDEFVKDACDLVETYRNLPSHPRVILMTAIPGFTNDSTEIWNKAIVRDINPLIIEAGKEAGVEVLDMHPVLAAHSELLPDTVHPNDKGAGMMARKMADYLKTWPEKPSKASTIDGFEEIKAPVNGVPQFDISWRGLGEDENWSMPLGNGDVAANVWTETNGDVLILISKTDSWSENAQLQKIGKVRVSLTPNPFVGKDDFTQSLSIATGVLTLKSGKNEVDVWIDANSPVVRVDSRTENPVKVKVTNELWRKNDYHLTQEQVNENVFNFWEWRSDPDGVDFLADTVLPSTSDGTAWCHFNSSSRYPKVLLQEHLGDLIGKYQDPLLHRCYGATVRGTGLASSDDVTMESVSCSKKNSIDVYVKTSFADSPQEWLSDLNKDIHKIEKISRSKARKAHINWWKNFWGRSWVYVNGDYSARQVYQGYTVNRYLTACAGRGEFPMKFNGSIFTVGHELPEGAVPSTLDHDPDFRDWGSCYWHQNTRHMYYPLVASGDYDMLMPWLNLYTNSLPLATDKVREYFGHSGASYIETMHFWGLPNLMDFGWNNPDKYPQSRYMRYHTQGALEIVYQMLDYYDNTLDKEYFASAILPFSKAVMTYYNEHWSRGEDGKILFDPIQSIEVYQYDVVNATPDIAGLWSLVGRFRNIPAELLDTEMLELLTSLERDLPEIPMGTLKSGKRGILPALKYGRIDNGENPELYPVFPYRNYCLGKPGLDLARDTFDARLFPFDNCWGQDGMQAALLGITGVARNAAVHAFTTYGKQRFPWFWAKVADYSPDMDNGGTGSMTLQLMLMQAEGRTIRIIPAWPKEWNADFKLHAPYNTTIECSVRNGKVSQMKVTPESRKMDIVIGTE